MSQIGCGLEYRVYDHSAGRVLKVRRGIPDRILASFLYSARSGALGGWPRIARKLLPLTNEVPGLVSRLAKKPAEIRKLLGHIELVRGNNYTQDLITPLRDYFAAHSFEENVAVVERYIEMTKSLWSLGVGDPYYSLLWNAGVYADGSVTQIDVSDLTTEASAVNESVRQQIWLLTAMPCIEDERFRVECIRLLNAGLTQTAFLEAWPQEMPGMAVSVNSYANGDSKGASLGARTTWGWVSQWQEKLRGYQAKFAPKAEQLNPE